MGRKSRLNLPFIEIDPVNPKNMVSMIARFLESMQISNYSENTVKMRELSFRYFLNWCNEREIKNPSEVTLDILELYRKWLYNYRKENEQPLNMGTQYNRTIAIRLFFKWLAQKKHLPYNPASELELPHLGKTLPKNILTSSEVNKILNMPDPTEPIGIRDRTMLETFYSTGIRRSELKNLKIHDVNMEQGLVIIRQGKGKKDRFIPIGERAIQWIEKYLTDSRHMLAGIGDDGTLFISVKGTPLSVHSIGMLTHRYVKKANVGKSGSCHIFRHTMATLMLENGADIRFIQQMLGHEKLTTTQIYTQVSIRKLKEVHTKTHPAKRKK